MTLYVIRLRDGNCIVATAENEGEAREKANRVAHQSEVATVRELSFFVAPFSLTDEGELRSTILDAQTLSDLHEHEYPMLKAARSHSYLDFGSSQSDSKTEHVLYSSTAARHLENWDGRDKDLIAYAVRQERERLAN